MNNHFPSRELVESLRKRYPVGCRVELLRMDDPQAPPVGTKGTVGWLSKYTTDSHPTYFSVKQPALAPAVPAQQMP